MDQVGYIKGCYLSQNVHAIEDIMLYAEKYDLSCLLVLVNFQKAFDTVEWHFFIQHAKSIQFRACLQIVDKFTIYRY